MTDRTREQARFGLHPGQIEPWRSPARFKVVVAGRRWGKTHFARTWLLARALSGKPGKYWYVGPTRDDAKDIMWSAIKEATHPGWLDAPPREVDLALNLIGGKEVRIWSAEKGDALKGRALRALVVDEYASMDERLFSEVLRPMLGDFKAPALFIGTPKSYNHFHKFYLRGMDPAFPSWASWQFKSLDNPFLDPLEVADARMTSDDRTFRQEWEASFEALAGRAYYAFTRADNVGDVQLQRGLPVCISFDFNVNPATCVIGQGYHDECRVWREVFVTHAGGEATMASATQARRLLTEAGWQGEIRLYGDATGTAMKTTGPSDHAVVRQVFPTAAWRVATSNPHPRDRVSAVNSRCQTSDGKRHLTVDRSCVRLIADLEQVIFDDKGELDQKSNPLLTHISDAFGYWVHREWPPVRKTMAGFASVEHLMV